MSIFDISSWSNQLKGTVCCVVGVLCISPDSLIVREVSNLPDMQVIFYKCLFLSLCLIIALVASQGIRAWETMKGIGWLGFWAGILWGISTFCVNYAFQTTAIANVLVILAANPMFSAISSYFILKEIIPRRTIIACLVCFTSIIIIVSSQLGNGTSGLVGIFNALIGSSTMGLYLVLIRYAAMVTGTEPDMMPCNIIAGLFICLVTIPFCSSFVAMTLRELLLLLFNGVFVLPVAFVLLTIGPSLISAPEVSLYTLIETVIGPIWVWLGGYEAPPITAVYGGILLISALAIHSFIAMREEEHKQKAILLKNVDDAFETKSTKDEYDEDQPL